MKALLDWMEHRTGAGKLLRRILYENIPGGSRWRYVWGSTLAFTFAVQLITGAALWAAYSPSSQTAWESVYYLQYEMSGGWLLRGIHHYASEAIVVLLVLHLVQIIIDGAYKAPREFNFWTGLVLMMLILALSLTGYLLPWDQKGYWATRVATNLLANVPLIGADLQRLVVGGSDYGHHTLTRFFALHAGVLPALVIALIAVHLALFRRHGITAKQPLRRGDQYFWPDQLLKNAVACLAVMTVIVFLVVRHRMIGESGAPLSAPADPSQPFDAARPEWHFLFLFQLLKSFHSQFIGAIVVPGIILLILALMPLLGRWTLGHRFNVAFTLALLAGMGALTGQALVTDRDDASYQRAAAAATRDADRAIALAQGPAGIPIEGALALVQRDPLTRGPQLFAENCAVCHAFDGHDGLGEKRKQAASASDLAQFASRAWLTGLLDPEQIATAGFFGNTAHKNGDMATFVREEVAVFDPDQREALKRVIVALSAQAKLPSQRAIDEHDVAIIEAGRQGFQTLGCVDCHIVDDGKGRPRGPKLTDYGSRAWLIEFISNPGHGDFYGKRNDRMPAFGADGVLDEAAIGLLADWLRGQWYRPPGSADEAASTEPGARGVTSSGDTVGEGG